MGKTTRKLNEEVDQNLGEMTFEQAYRDLEQTVQQLEAGNLALAEALTLYRRGVALAQLCGQQLDSAELSIQMLTPAGELADFDEE